AQTPRPSPGHLLPSNAVDRVAVSTRSPLSDLSLSPASSPRRTVQNHAAIRKMGCLGRLHGVDLHQSTFIEFRRRIARPAAAVECLPRCSLAEDRGLDGDRLLARAAPLAYAGPPRADNDR